MVQWLFVLFEEPKSCQFNIIKKKWMKNNKSWKKFEENSAGFLSVFYPLKSICSVSSHFIKVFFVFFDFFSISTSIFFCIEIDKSLVENIRIIDIIRTTKFVFKFNLWYNRILVMELFLIIQKYNKHYLQLTQMFRLRFRINHQTN